MTVNPSSSRSPTENAKLFKFIFVVSAISLVPFIIFLFFTIPCSDDIFYHNYVIKRSLWDFMVDHYSTWTGRYVSNLLMAVNPFTLTSNPAVYPAMMLTLFLFFFWALYFFIKSSLKLLPTRLSNNFSHSQISLMSSFLFLALFFHKMPRTTDSFYWFAGASSHLLPLSLILFSLGFYFKSKLENKFSLLTVLFMALVSFLVSGSNETLALQWIFILTFLIFFQKIINLRWEKRLFLPLALALIGFAILYFAPGNAVRAKELKGGHDIGLLLIKPLGLVFETTVRYLSLALLFIVLWGAPIFRKINQNLPANFKSQKSLVVLTLFGLGLFILTFIPSVWTMGGLPPRRVLNNTYLMFLLYGGFLTSAAYQKLGFLDRWSDFLESKMSIRAQKLVFAISLLFLFNNYYAWMDLINLPKFNQAVMQRSIVVEAGKNQDLVLAPLSYFPTTFFYEDITLKPDDYRNTAFSEFYGIKSVILSKDYP